MGFPDRDVENSFDGLFDMNRNGKLDVFEQGLQLDFLARGGRMDSDEDLFDDEGERLDKLESLGIDPDDLEELEFLDAAEREERLEELGLDMEDLDF